MIKNCQFSRKEMLISMQQICVSLSAGKTVPSLSEGRNCKVSLGMRMQMLTNF